MEHQASEVARAVAVFKLADADTLSAAELIERAQAAARRRTTLRPHAAVSS